MPIFGLDNLKYWLAPEDNLIKQNLFSLFLKGILQDWWDPVTNKGFKDKAQCIIWQYGNYTSEQVSLNLNGINTQGENIADNGGIKEAYLGYKKWVQDNDIIEPKLPGHDYTSEQLFWISWGQVHILY